MSWVEETTTACHHCCRGLNVFFSFAHQHHSVWPTEWVICLSIIWRHNAPGSELNYNSGEKNRIRFSLLNNHLADSTEKNIQGEMYFHPVCLNNLFKVFVSYRPQAFCSIVPYVIQINDWSLTLQLSPDYTWKTMRSITVTLYQWKESLVNNNHLWIFSFYRLV